jgi:ABC-2 type transport system ATP-binding protein
MFSKNPEDNTEENLNKIAAEIQTSLHKEFPSAENIAVCSNEEWIDIFINEDEIKMMEIMNFIQNTRNIVDVKITEISTESVIKKIYEGGVK